MVLTPCSSPIIRGPFDGEEKEAEPVFVEYMQPQRGDRAFERHPVETVHAHPRMKVLRRAEYVGASWTQESLLGAHLSGEHVQERVELVR